MEGIKWMAMDWPPRPRIQHRCHPHGGPTVAPLANARAAAPSTQPSGLNSFAIALAAALIGGFILNLMPCVLPVLAIKVLGFTHPMAAKVTPRTAPRAWLRRAWCSPFWRWAVWMLFLRRGRAAGVGGQLQSPWCWPYQRHCLP